MGAGAIGAGLHGQVVEALRPWFTQTAISNLPSAGITFGFVVKIPEGINQPFFARFFA